MAKKRNRSLGRLPSRAVLMAAAAGLVAGCQEYPLLQSFTGPADRNAEIPELTDSAAICGRSLGIAVRCNLVGGDRDFAVLRYAVLDGLRGQGGAMTEFDRVEMALDVATLEMINTVGACAVSDAQLPMLEQEIETTLATCTAP